MLRVLPNSRKALIVGEYAEKWARMKNSPMQYSKPTLKIALTLETKRLSSKLAKKIGMTKKEVETALEEPIASKKFMQITG